jgi:hypothetical protein
MGQNSTKQESEIFNIIDDVKKIINNRIIMSVRPISNSCFGKKPCVGHVGILMIFDLGPPLRYICSSDEIAAIMCYYNINNAHFMECLNKRTIKRINKMPKN